VGKSERKTMSQIKGVDTSVSSPTTTVSLKESQENLRSCAKKEMKEKPGSAVDLDYIPKFDEGEIPAETPLSPEYSQPSVFDSNPTAYDVAIKTTTHIVSGAVTPNLELLLGSVLGTIDASIPNKEQNKAVKHIIRMAFDEAYSDILRRSYPSTFSFSGEYCLEPLTRKEVAFQRGSIKV
jgi:hypothetical protein